VRGSGKPTAAPSSSTEPDTQGEDQDPDPNTGRQGGDTLRDVAEATGGFSFDSGNFGESLDLIFESIRRDLHRIDWIRDNLPSNGSLIIQVPIDSTVTVAEFVLNVSKCQEFEVAAYRPDGSIVQRNDQRAEIKEIPGFTRIRIMQPPVGVWKVAIKGEGRFLFTADGQTPVRIFDMQFYRMTGESGSCGPVVEDVTPTLLLGQKVFVQANIIGKISEPSIEFLTANGRLMERLETKFDSSEDLFADYTPSHPCDSFVARVSGKDDAGRPLQRILSREFSVHSFVIRQYFSATPDAPGHFRFQAQNAGKPDRFTFDAETLEKSSIRISPSEIELPSDGTAFIDVEVDIDKAKVHRGARLYVSMKSANTSALSETSTLLERD